MTASFPTVSVLVVGVGGQGAITAARVIGEAARASGLPVRIGQIHGMSQRGGSVESTVVIGPGDSPFLPLRGADVVVALEPLELLRARPRLHPGSRVAVSRAHIVPTPMALQGAEYPDPDGIFDTIRPLVADLVAVDGRALASDGGGAGPINAAMLGVLASQSWLPFAGDAVLAQFEQRSPPKYLESNRRAFAAGRGAMTS